MLTFKQFYKIEANKIKSNYHCTFKEAIECLKLRSIQNEFIEYLEQFNIIPRKIIKTIPFEPRRKLFIKYNLDKIQGFQPKKEFYL